MIIYRLSRLLRKNLRESKVWRGFYEHPTDKDLLFSIHGMCINRKSSKVYNFSYSGDKYIHFRHNGVSNLLHRYVAETFLEKPCGAIEVNHIDGVKSNPSVFNLEWVTVSGNVIHAYKSGLRSDNKTVMARRLDTGEVFEFHSYNECARYLGVNTYKVSALLKDGRNKKFTIGKIYEIKRPWDEWFLNKDHIGRDLTSGTDLVIRKLNTEVYFLFSTVPQASEYTGLKEHLIYSHISGGSVNLKTHGFEACRLTDTNIPVRDMVDMRIEKTFDVLPKRKPIPIKVSKEGCDKSIVYESTEAFAKELGVKKNTLQKAVYLNKGKYKEYFIEYLL